MKGMIDKCDHQYAFAQVKMAKVCGENAPVDARLVEETQASSQRKMPHDLIPIVKCTKVDVARRPTVNAAPKLLSNQIHSTLPLSPR
jgi:hypothetical protein